MKWKQFYFIVMLVASTMVSAAAVAQNGYWEVITTDSLPRISTVRFYDLGRHLIYEEVVKGMVLDLYKRSTRRKLDRSLQTALAAWRKNRRMGKDRGIVAMNMGR